MINLAALFSVHEGCRVSLCIPVKPDYRLHQTSPAYEHSHPLPDAWQSQSLLTQTNQRPKQEGWHEL